MRYLRVSGLKLDGRGKAADSQSGTAIKFENADDVEFSFNEVTRFNAATKPGHGDSVCDDTNACGSAQVFLFGPEPVSERGS
jgi:hypothetical protein